MKLLKSWEFLFPFPYVHHQVHDFGWPDLHAPLLDKICAICKAMEMWLTSDPQHVVVLHCKVSSGGHRSL